MREKLLDQWQPGTVTQSNRRAWGRRSEEAQRGRFRNKTLQESVHDLHWHAWEGGMVLVGLSGPSWPSESYAKFIIRQPSCPPTSSRVVGMIAHLTSEVVWMQTILDRKAAVVSARSG